MLARTEPVFLPERQRPIVFSVPRPTLNQLPALWLAAVTLTAFERFTLANRAFSQSFVDLAGRFVQRWDIHFRQVPDGSRPP